MIIFLLSFHKYTHTHIYIYIYTYTHTHTHTHTNTHTHTRQRSTPCIHVASYLLKTVNTLAMHSLHSTLPQLRYSIKGIRNTLSP